MIGHSPSSAQIAEQLSAVALELASLERRAENLAFAAVGGDEEAVAALAGVNAQIDRARADVLVFQRAKATADRLAAEAEEEAAAIKRAAHHAEARRQADALVKLVAQGDAAVDAFMALNRQIAAGEAALHRETRSAGIDIGQALVGIRGADVLILERLRAATSHHASYRDNPPVVDRIRHAWASLLGEDSNDV